MSYGLMGWVPEPRLQLTIRTSTPEVMAYLRQGRDDDQIEAMVIEVNRQCFQIFGAGYRWRYDRFGMRGDLANRVYFKRPRRID